MYFYLNIRKLIGHIVLNISKNQLFKNCWVFFIFLRFYFWLNYKKIVHTRGYVDMLDNKSSNIMKSNKYNG